MGRKRRKCKNMRYHPVMIRTEVYRKLEELVELVKRIDIYKNFGDETIIEKDLYCARREGRPSKYSLSYWLNKILEENIDKLIQEKQLEWDELKVYGRKSELYRLKRLIDGWSGDGCGF